MDPLLRLSEVPQAPDSGGDLLVVGTDGAAVPERPEVLAGVEAEGSSAAERAGSALAAACSVCLGSILNDQEAVARREGVYRIHVADLAVEVNGDDRRRALVHRRRIDVDQPGAVVHIAEDGGGPGVNDGEGAGDERVGGHDHLVSGPDPGRQERESERGGSRADPDAVAHPAVACELPLELFEVPAENEAAVIQDAIECRAKVRRDRRVVSRQAHEGDRSGGRDGVERSHQPPPEAADGIGLSLPSSLKTSRLAGSLGSSKMTAASLRERTESLAKAEVRWLLTVLLET